MSTLERAVLLICLCILALFCLDQARAADYIVVNTAASHWNRKAVVENNLNEVNPGLGFEHDVSTTTKISTGFYRNSIRRSSIYVAVIYQPYSIGVVSAGMFGGAVTGYRDAVLPIIGGIITWQLGRAGMNIVMVPSVPRKNIYGYAALQIKWEFK